MAELKTRPTDADVKAYLDSIPDERKREDSFALLELMKDITKAEPTMWGESIVGFGSYHYTYASGREGDWLLTGFAPRKRELTHLRCPGSRHSPRRSGGVWTRRSWNTIIVV
ncbi:MAG: hypothetical protein KKA32_04770 [Actinobacteria bacterium]|nr:hypothetical protein [Actinomycetota bacterium]